MAPNATTSKPTNRRKPATTTRSTTTTTRPKSRPSPATTKTNRTTKKSPPRNGTARSNASSTSASTRSTNSHTNRRNTTTRTSKLRSTNATTGDPWEALEADLAGSLSLNPEQVKARVQTELSKARKSGQLSLKESGLTSPLPEAMFRMRAAMAEEGGRSWECHGEETLISLDLSENDLSGGVSGDDEKPDVYAPKSKGSNVSTATAPKPKSRNGRASAGKKTKPSTPPSPPVVQIPGMLDERVGCFVSLRTLRVKRCRLTKLPWDIVQQQLTSLVILDASDNDMDAFQLERMPPSLSTLDISRNKITTLTLADRDQAPTDQIIDLPNLTHFDANCNKITTLPLVQVNTPTLQHLFLSQNKLQTLEPTLPSSSSPSPPSLLQSCQNTLQTLYAPENSLTQCPDLHHHSKLTVVELRMNQLTSPPTIHGNLVRLHLNNNKIQSIQNLYPPLQNQTTSKIDQNNNDTTPPFESLIQDGYYRTNLKELHLQSNSISTPPDTTTLSVMTKLTFLDISHNDLDTLPPLLGYLPELRRVALDGNPLRMIRHAVKMNEDGGGVDTERLKGSMRMKGLPPDGPGYLPPEVDASQSNGGGGGGRASTPEERKAYAQRLVRSATTGEKKLDMSQGNYPGKLSADEILTALGEEIRDSATTTAKCGTMITTWDISGSKVAMIGPEWINALENVSVLDVHQNFMNCLPENVSTLGLRTLFAASNLLTAVELERMVCVDTESRLVKNLQYLDLSGNKIEWVPGGLFELTSLKSLNLSHNKIKDLVWQTEKDLKDNENNDETAEDKHISRGWKHGLTELIQLDLSNNHLSDLGYMPMAISGSKSLRTLHLNNNNLTEIPLELGLLKQLTTITLGGNPQKAIRTNILSQSCDAILQYLHDKMEPAEVERVEKQHRAIEVALDAQGEEDRRKGLEGSVRELKLMIDEANAQLEKISISAAKRNELKKDLAIYRAKLNREEKLLVVEGAS